MRTLFCGITASLLLASAIGAQNLLTNPSFEEPDVAPGTAQIFAGNIAGWTDSSSCGIEVQDNCCGSPSDGSQHVELDSDCSSTISQTVSTTPGAKYVLTFDFSPRPGVVDNRLVVRWNGVQIFDELAAGAPPPADTDWNAHAIGVTATGTTSTVEFEDGSFSSPGVGTYIDHLPEPAGRPRCSRASR